MFGQNSSIASKRTKSKPGDRLDIVKISDRNSLGSANRRNCNYKINRIAGTVPASKVVKDSDKTAEPTLRRLERRYFAKLWVRRYPKGGRISTCRSGQVCRRWFWPGCGPPGALVDSRLRGSDEGGQLQFEAHWQIMAEAPGG